MAEWIQTQQLTRRVTAPPKRWPAGAATAMVYIDDDGLLPGTACKLTFIGLWDNGRHYRDSSVIDGSLPHRGADGTCHFGWGPFMVRDMSVDDPLAQKMDNPTRYRVELEPVRGAPVVGIR